MRDRGKSEIGSVINWASRYLNKEAPPSRIGRQQLYMYDDGALICVKTSNRATERDGTLSEHYWFGLSYDIVAKLADAHSSACIFQLADSGQYIVLPRDQLAEIYQTIPPRAERRRYDIAIWPHKSYEAVIERRHFNWAQFCHEEELIPHVIAAFSQIAEEIPSEIHYYEGAVDRIEVNKYERDARARSECLRHHGTACAACGCDMSEIYGDDLRGFIHVHHIVPISSLCKEYSVDPEMDLIPLCPNCHAVVHKFTEPLTIEQLKGRLAKGVGQAPELCPI